MSIDAQELVRGIYAAYARRDVAAAFANFSPDIKFAQTSELPWGGDYDGVALRRRGSRRAGVRPYGPRQRRAARRPPQRPPPLLRVHRPMARVERRAVAQ